MILRDILPDFEGYDIKVGFGSSFVYCDTYTDKTVPEIEFQSESELERMKTRLSTLESQMHLVQKNGFDKYAQKKYIAECARVDNYNFDPKNVDRAKKKYPDESLFYEKLRVKYGNLKSNIRSLRRRIKEFVPFMDREIEEIYDSCCEPQTKILVGKKNGYVDGDFWDSQEYRDRDANGRVKAKYKAMG